MVRRRRLVPVAIACAVGWALAPGAAQAAAARSAVAQAAAAAGPAARPVAALVDDIAPGPASSDPRDLTAMNGELYFTAWTLRHSRQLWKTNGTAAGTAMLTHVAGPSGADPQDLTVADGVLFFSARDPGHGRKLWKSNGTAAGTTLVPGRTGSDPRDITYAIGQQEQNPPNQVLVYFSARDPGHGRQLWKSDGTAAGTAMITDVNPRSGGLAPQDIAPVSGPAAMFSGDDGVHGREPWVTDGTTAGTRMYEDLNPGRAGSDPAQITPEQYVAGFVAQFPIWYFSADDGTHGREFFVAYNDDPPAEVYDVNPGLPCAAGLAHGQLGGQGMDVGVPAVRRARPARRSPMVYETGSSLPPQSYTLGERSAAFWTEVSHAADLRVWGGKDGYDRARLARVVADGVADPRFDDHRVAGPRGLGPATDYDGAFADGDQQDLFYLVGVLGDRFTAGEVVDEDGHRIRSTTPVDQALQRRELGSTHKNRAIVAPHD